MVHTVCAPRPFYSSLFSDWGPVSRKSRKPFGSVKPFLVSSVSKNEEVYTPETSCMKGTSVHMKNTWIKQLCNHTVWDFATAFRVRKLFGTFEKQAPGLWMAARLQVTLFWYRPHCFCCVNQVVLMLSSWHLKEKSREVSGLYQSKVTSRLACIHRPGNKAHNCKMAYWVASC